MTCPHCGVAMGPGSQCSFCGLSFIPESERPSRLVAEDVPEQDRNWAMFLHLSQLLPVVGFLGPLVLWLAKRAQSPFVDRHGKAALNYQITLNVLLLVSIAFIIAGAGTSGSYSPFQLSSGLFSLSLLFMLATFALGLIGWVAAIVAAVRASNGRYFEYPFALPILRG